MTKNSHTLQFNKETWSRDQLPFLIISFGPILITTTTFSNALILSGAFLLTLILSTILVYILKRLIYPEIKSLSLLVIISSSVTIVELIVQAYSFENFLGLEAFFPLIATNFLILTSMETVLQKNSSSLTKYDVFKLGLSGFVVLVSLGFARELIGTGKVFFDTTIPVNSSSIVFEISLPQFYSPLILLTLPSGAFIAIGLFLAFFNSIKSETDCT